MARAPQHRTIREEWIRFFVGTPLRFVLTLLVLFTIFSRFFPYLSREIIGNSTNAFLIAFEAPLTIAALVALAYFLLKPWWSSKK